MTEAKCLPFFGGLASIGRLSNRPEPLRRRRGPDGCHGTAPRAHQSLTFTEVGVSAQRLESGPTVPASSISNGHSCPEDRIVQPWRCASYKRSPHRARDRRPRITKIPITTIATMLAQDALFRSLPKGLTQHGSYILSANAVPTRLSYQINRSTAAPSGGVRISELRLI
jgi:hypothetical protein